MAELNKNLVSKKNHPSYLLIRVKQVFVRSQYTFVSFGKIVKIGFHFNLYHALLSGYMNGFPINFQMLYLGD